jgi:nucleotide-binding universal stress UspA family protein
MGITPKWRCGLNSPEDALVELAFLADLVVTSAPQSADCANVSPATLALRSGAAVLRLSHGAQADLSDNVIVAWKDAREAHCALLAALPILRTAKRVTVVGVGDEATTERLEAVVAYLQPHGVVAQSRHLPARKSAAHGLLDFLEQSDWPLLVAGARGRGLWTERLFGGITRELLASPQVSWLMAT